MLHASMLVCLVCKLFLIVTEHIALGLEAIITATVIVISIRYLSKVQFLIVCDHLGLISHNQGRRSYA